MSNRHGVYKTEPFLDRGTWCELLPVCHNELACHTASTERRRILNSMKDVINKFADKSVCPEWDARETLNDTPGPFRFGEYKPRDNLPGTVKSEELIGGDLIRKCNCLMRNGLQDDCRRTDCRGNDACLTSPFPSCAPFTGRYTEFNVVPVSDNCDTNACVWKDRTNKPICDETLNRSGEHQCNHIH